MSTNPLYNAAATIGRPYEYGGFYPARLAVWAVIATLPFAISRTAGLAICVAFYVLLMWSIATAPKAGEYRPPVESREARKANAVDILLVTLGLQLPLLAYLVTRAIARGSDTWFVYLGFPVVSLALWFITGGDKSSQKPERRL